MTFWMDDGRIDMLRSITYRTEEFDNIKNVGRMQSSMETKPLPEAEKEPSIKLPHKELSRIQKWTRIALLGLASLGLSGVYTAQSEKSLRPVPAARSKTADMDIPGTILEERLRHPNLTEDEYLDLLASRLITPERLHRFFLEKMNDTKDYEDGQDPADHWQTPEETVRRVQRVTRQRVINGGLGGVQTYEQLAMCGDCEDYAFLAQEILWRQGKTAHVVDLPEGHSACVWIEKNSNGRYNSFVLDQGGVIRNGQTVDQPSASAPDGFDSLQEAFNTAINRFEQLQWTNMNPAFIPVDRMRGGVGYKDAITLQAFNHDLPHLPSYIDFLIAMGICSAAYGIPQLIKRRRNGEIWKEYFTTFRLT